MKVTDLYKKLDQKIPAALSCDWDNDGLMCCSHHLREVERVLFTLDITADAVEYAADNRFDCIISHHPMIFRPLTAVVDPALSVLIKNDITAMSFHTRLDALDGGVNDCLASLLKIKYTEPFGECSIGRLGMLKKRMPSLQFCEHVKELLRCHDVRAVLPNSFCEKVAVVGGEGGDFIESAVLAGADTLITGNAGYHALTDASRGGMNIICAGHYYTEQPVLYVLESMVREFVPQAYTERFASNVILNI